MKSYSETSDDLTIELLDIPEEGQSYAYNNQSKAILPFLAELIGDNPLKVQISVQPLGNAYEMTGSVETQLNLLCSRCGIDIKYPIKQKIHELFLLDAPRPRKTHNINQMGSGLNTQDPFCSYLEKSELHMGDLLNEIITLAEPNQPTGQENCDDSCENLQEFLKKGILSLEKDSTSHSPFQALQGFQVKKGTNVDPSEKS